MQPTDHRDRVHTAALPWLDFSFYWSVAIKGKVCSRLVIIVQVRSQYSPEVSLVQNDDMINALTPNRTNESLNVGILPRRPWSSQNFLDAHVADAPLKHVAIDPL